MSPATAGGEGARERPRDPGGGRPGVVRRGRTGAVPFSAGRVTPIYDIKQYEGTYVSLARCHPFIHMILINVEIVRSSLHIFSTA
jgi:hypothetical protein